MECATRWGVVQAVEDLPGRQELVVALDQEEARAVNYPELTGYCRPGDLILINTTAVSLRLGTGGWHYVLAVAGRERSLSSVPGHIMKLRYTPLQGRVLAVEEEASPHHQALAEADSLQGLPVAVGSLHSMLAPLAWLLVHRLGQVQRLVYLMSDGAALPLALSRAVEQLKEEGLLYKTITFGHAFGGDLEAVNIYSALLAAKHVLQADAAVVLMGPGVVGTGTKWGSTALEQGIFLNAVIQLGGRPVAIARLSSGDPRPRHQGLSHHTQTVLRRIVQAEVKLPLPHCFQEFPGWREQLAGLGHEISWEDTAASYASLAQSSLEFSTMGRGLKEDPLFFHGVAAAAQTLGRLAQSS